MRQAQAPRAVPGLRPGVPRVQSRLHQGPAAPAEQAPAEQALDPQRAGARTDRVRPRREGEAQIFQGDEPHATLQRRTRGSNV